jgi:nitrilase
MRVAAAQTSPAWGDKVATTAKVVDWIGRAAAESAELVVFGETFLSGYPFWVSVTDGARWNDERQKAAYAAYLDAAVELDGPELAEITAAVRESGVFTYLGITERGSGSGRGTVYCTLVAIDPGAGIVSAHRKLMPTYDERMVWGTGDGHGLRVHRLATGWNVGGLNCWENWMPQARHAMYAGGEDLHIAVWPGSASLTRDITRFIALEGRCYVLSVGSLLSVADVTPTFPLAAEVVGLDLGFNGGSALAAPDGSWVVEPVVGEERLIVADLDLERVRRERHNFDPAGHYNRSDVFDVTVDRRRLQAAKFSD